LNRPTKVVEADGTTYRIEYDAAGRVAATVDAAGNRTVNAYDAAGRLIKITNAAGGVREFGYDANGNRTSVKEPDGSVTTYEYDALDRLVKTIAPNGATVSTIWNLTGTKQAEIDSAANRFDYKYDALNRLVEVKQTDGNSALVTAYAFDSVGNKVSQTDAEGRVTRWEYDAGRRPVSRTLPSGLTERFAYDTLGNVTQVTAFDGSTSSTAFNAMGQMTLHLRPDGGRIEKRYTPSGMLAEVTVSGPISSGVESGTTKFSYDALDRIVRQTNPDGTFLAYAYDAGGNLTERSTRGGGVHYTFDAIGRMESATDAAGKKTTYAYDVAGRLASATLPDGTVSRRRYDEGGRLQQIVHLKADGSVLAGVRYAFTAAGLRQSKDEFDDQSTLAGDIVSNPSRTHSYVYDSANRLKQEVVRGRDGTAIYSVDYEYDKVGNRTRKTLAQGAVTEITGYSYDHNDRLIESRRTAGAGETVTKYGWDDNGNLTSKQIGNVYTRFEWNSANQLVSVSQGSGPQSLQVVAQYSYDAQGNRSSRTVPAMGSEPAAITRYTTDNSFLYGQTLEESTVKGASKASVQYVWGTELHYSSQTSGITTLLADGQGTVQAQITSEQIERTAGFDAFGVSNGEQTSGYGYTGEYFDGVIGLQFNRARWYDPEIGRFISADTYTGAPARPLTLNRYIYADADPVNKLDRSGNMSLSEQGAVAEGQGALSSAAVPNIGRQYASRLAKKAGDAFTDKIENAIKDCLKPGVSMKSGTGVPKVRTNDGRWAMPDFMFQVGDKIAYLEAKTKLPGLKSIGDQFQRVGKQLQAAIDNNRPIGVITQTKHRDATLEKRKADILNTLSGDGGLVTFINGFHGLLSFVGEYVIEECVESAIGL
jgi:RHS repeat-associated protein